MSKKVMLQMMVFCLTAISLFATGQDEEQAGSGSSIYQVREGCEEPLEISMGWWGIDTFLVENDQLREKIEGEFNIKIKGQNFTWSDWQEKCRLWAVSGELPDVFANSIVNTPDYFKWIDQGIIEPLPRDLSEYPNIDRVMKIEEIKALTQPDGNRYIIPRIKQYEDDQTTMARGMFVRKDWMEKLNFENPGSFEEFYAMTRAFVEDDPDGNGMDDTVGITTHNKHYLPTLFLSTCPNALNDSWVKRDGQWIPSWTTPEFNEGLTQVHKLFHDGILDPDMAILKGMEGREKFASGKVGVYLAQTTPGNAKQLKLSWEKYNDTPFEDSIGILHVWPSKDGVQYRHTEKSFWSSTYFRGGLEEEKMERILMLYDYLLSEEGVKLLTYGIEGEDYVQDGDQITLTWEKDADGNTIDLLNKYKSLGIFQGMPSWYEFTWYEDNPINRLNFTEEALKMSLDSFNWKMENAEAIPTNYLIDLMVTPAKTKIVFNSDSLIRVVLSPEDPILGWEKVIDDFRAKGLNQAIYEVNEKAQLLGY